MEIKEFAQKIQKAILAVLGEDYDVRIQEVQKNNGVLLQGLIIMKKEQNISPTIYLQPFWEAYKEGVTLAMLVDKVLQVYREDTPKDNIDMSFFKNFEEVKDRICYRLIHAKQNQHLLEQIPHIPFLDLAICFYYAYEGNILGKGSILIYDSHLAIWQTSTAELMRLAQSNTPRIFPWECNSMEQVLRELLQGEKAKEILSEWDPQELWREESAMYIVSNSSKQHGAACILYPEVLVLLGEKLSADFFIIPSSVHEVILLPDKGIEDGKILKEMIENVNRTQVEPEEVLSNSLYYFSRKEKKVKVI